MKLWNKSPATGKEKLAAGASSQQEEAEERRVAGYAG